MTEQTGSTQPPEWYTNPPTWLQQPPARRRDRDDDRDDYRDRDRGRNDVRDLETAIRGMPEAVVSALKEAIQGATQQRQVADNSTGQQKPPEQQGNGEQQRSDDAPREQLSFADKWFSNSL